MAHDYAEGVPIPLAKLKVAVKCGTHPIEDVIGYAEQVPEHGLYFKDSSGNDIECVGKLTKAEILGHQ